MSHDKEKETVRDAAREKWVETIEGMMVMRQPGMSEYANACSFTYKKHKNAVRAYRQGRISREKRDALILSALREENGTRSVLPTAVDAASAMSILRSAGLVKDVL